MPSTDRLVEFVAAVDAGSISAAAERLGVPRATLSRRLGDLEQELGVPLLHRTARGLGVTAAGEVLLDRARKVLVDVEGTWRAVRELQDTPRGPLRVSAPPTLLLQDLFIAFMLAYPAIDVLVAGDPRHVDLVTEGFDVAIRFGSLHDDTVVARRLWADRYSLVASAAYLDEHGRPEAVSELRRHRGIFAHPQSGLSRREWPLLDGGTLRTDAAVVVSDYVMGLHAAVSGVGLMLLPDPMTEPHRQLGQIEFVLPDDVGHTLPCYVVYPDRRLLPQVRAFVEFTLAFYEHATPTMHERITLEPIRIEPGGA